MQNLQTISTKELRDNLAEILEKVAIGRQAFLVSKFGKEKALIAPVGTTYNKMKKRTSLRDHPACGIWKERKDMEDSTAWVSKMRIKQSKRIR